MSGIALSGGLEATIGLVPRYLRSRGADASQEWEAAAGAAAQQVNDPFAAEAVELPGMRGLSVTDELRRRIADAAVPEKRGRKPLWYGLAAVAVIVVLAALFPEMLLSLLPGADNSL